MTNIYSNSLLARTVGARVHGFDERYRRVDDRDVFLDEERAAKGSVVIGGEAFPPQLPNARVQLLEHKVLEQVVQVERCDDCSADG